MENLTPDQVSCLETEVIQEDDLKYEVNEEEYGDEEEEFSFMCAGGNSPPITAEDAFINGQLRSILPLFNRDLLFSGEDSDGRPPVKNIFVETGEGYGEVVSPTAEASPETCKKSNSTGFSKIWRFKDLLGRSNSDGRDAFVFLNNTHAAPEQPPPTAAPAVKKVKKGKTAPLTAHEVYLKSKAKAEGRRRTYLPYRPELMGFFTNVNGGLSKNVHPF